VLESRPHIACLLISSLQNFSGLIQQLVQKENQVLELQEEVNRLSTTSSQRGGAEEVRIFTLAPKAQANVASIQTDRSEERAR